jgi:hypothetical protein
MTTLLPLISPKIHPISPDAVSAKGSSYNPLLLHRLSRAPDAKGRILQASLFVSQIPYLAAGLPRLTCRRSLISVAIFHLMYYRACQLVCAVDTCYLHTLFLGFLCFSFFCLLVYRGERRDEILRNAGISSIIEK